MLGFSSPNALFPYPLGASNTAGFGASLGCFNASQMGATPSFGAGGYWRPYQGSTANPTIAKQGAAMAVAVNSTAMGATTPFLGSSVTWNRLPTFGSPPAPLLCVISYQTIDMNHNDLLLLLVCCSPAAQICGVPGGGVTGTPSPTHSAAPGNGTAGSPSHSPMATASTLPFPTPSISHSPAGGLGNGTATPSSSPAATAIVHTGVGGSSVLPACGNGQTPIYDTASGFGLQGVNPSGFSIDCVQPMLVRPKPCLKFC